MAPASIFDDTQACIDKIEQRIRSLHVFYGVIGWDEYDDLPVAALLVEFHMPDIERYTRIRCPCIHLQFHMPGIDWSRSALVCLIGPLKA